MPTGYSEIVFGELFRATGWRRDEVVAANKLWWEHWPDNVAAVATSSRRNDDRIARIRPFAI
jgi:aryl-alcohol dehydrogenase-like predicted oxidoreductase